jgi:hypothetical protein
MRLFSLRACLGLSTLGLLSSGLQAGTVQPIVFNDGNPLYVQSVVGSGPDTAYLTIDLASGTDVSWQYNFDPTNGPVNGWQMLSDVSAADPELQISATYYPSFAEHYVNNFQYGAVLGARNKWDFYTGSYNPANVSSSNPQGTSWTAGSTGIDQVNLSNNEQIGFVDVYPSPPLPVLSESLAAVPEPASLGLILLGSPLLMRRRR